MRRRHFAAVGTLNNATLVDLKTPVAAETIFVTKLTLSITTHAAKFVAVQDDAASPVVIAKHTDATAAAGVLSVVTWDFGKRGVPLTVGKKLQCVSEATGVAGIVYAEGFIL